MLRYPSANKYDYYVDEPEETMEDGIVFYTADELRKRNISERWIELIEKMQSLMGNDADIKQYASNIANKERSGIEC